MGSNAEVSGGPARQDLSTNHAAQSVRGTGLLGLSQLVKAEILNERAEIGVAIYHNGHTLNGRKLPECSFNRVPEDEGS